MKLYCPNKQRLLAVITVLLLAAGCANPGNESSEKGDFLESASNDLATLPEEVVDGSKEACLQERRLTALLIASGVSVIMHNSSADDNLADNFERHRVIDGFFSKSLSVVGGPGFHFAATGLWYAISAEKKDQFNKGRAWAMTKALSVTGAITIGLKAIRDNKTPNGKKWAWPSGHTSSSFTVAAVLDEFYGPKVGVPAYITASLVAYRMMDEADHWASDVVFGATLGWVVGHTIAGKHKNIELAGFEVLPYAGSNGEAVIGVSLVKVF